jgi:hypothetical protein
MSAANAAQLQNHAFRTPRRYITHRPSCGTIDDRSQWRLGTGFGGGGPRQTGHHHPQRTADLGTPCIFNLGDSPMAWAWMINTGPEFLPLEGKSPP